MTRKQVQIVKSSFQMLTPQRNRLAGLFFAQLLVREPSLRAVFRGDLRSQGTALFEGLAAIVDSVDRLYPIVPALEWLAVQSARRGLSDRHYPAVIEAMLSALRDGLGTGFTVEVELAWREAARQVATVMIRALEAEPLAA